jgi:hypothetical protein|tara:strand:+ start:358 stop:996 length:639 start_codon:yes stop_codon:yes gene_type:complete
MYFKNLPNIQYNQKPISYPFSESDTIIAKNLFKRFQVNANVFSHGVYFKKYTIQDGERPDSLAKKAYGDVFYDWVILITNNMVNAQYDWPMTNHQIYKTIENEYTDPYSEIHHYVIKDDIGQFKKDVWVDETFYNGTHKIYNSDTGTYISKAGNTIAQAVPVAEHFTTENDKKREIYLLKPAYFQMFVNDFKKQNIYLKSSNYINKKLKATS